MTQVIRCHLCDRKVGTREELILHIRKGCEVEILVTCAECLKPKETPRYDTTEFDNIFNRLFGRGK